MYDGGKAFPQTLIEIERGKLSLDEWGAGGMSLRDWFAGMALECGIVSRRLLSCDVEKWAEQIAEDVYTIADAMLKQKEKRINE